MLYYKTTRVKVCIVIFFLDNVLDPTCFLFFSLCKSLCECNICFFPILYVCYFINYNVLVIIYVPYDCCNFLLQSTNPSYNVKLRVQEKVHIIVSYLTGSNYPKSTELLKLAVRLIYVQIRLAFSPIRSMFLVTNLVC